MGYSFQYSTDLNKELAISQRKTISNKQKAIIGVIIACLLIFMIPAVRDFTVSFFIPGDREVTADALSNMIFQIRKGESFRDAIHAFCETVIDNG